MQDEQVHAAQPDAPGGAQPSGEDLMQSPESLDMLKELIEFLKSTGVAEFDVERGNLKLRLKFQSAVPALAATAAPDLAQLAHVLAAGQASAAPTASPAAQAAAAPAPEAQPETKHHVVKSPLVGTLYESPSPGAAPFVKIGETVEVGQVLCIVEAMKLMNEVESDAAGEVVARIAANGQPVEYGQPLFEIKPR